MIKLKRQNELQSSKRFETNNDFRYGIQHLPIVSMFGQEDIRVQVAYNKRYQTYNALRSDRRPNDRASGLVERIDERLQDLGIVHVGPQGNCYLLHLQFVFLLNNSVFFEEN